MYKNKFLSKALFKSGFITKNRRGVARLPRDAPVYYGQNLPQLPPYRRVYM